MMRILLGAGIRSAWEKSPTIAFVIRFSWGKDCGGYDRVVGWIKIPE
jgi:hypothetical protein